MKMKLQHFRGGSGKPARVLHIVENLNFQAVETWLIRMMEKAVSKGVELDWTFYCVAGVAGAHDEVVRSLGGQVIHSAHPIGRWLHFIADLRAELRRGTYDVLHCHHDVMCAPYLIAAAGLPISIRIVHAHNADMNLPTASRLKKLLFAELFRRICLNGDKVIGISQHTLDTMLNGLSRKPDRDRVHYYGVDPSPFTVQAEPAAFRQRLGLPADAKILLFGGRIVPEKNPLFTVDVLAALRAREPRAIAVFAGAGSLEDAVRDRALALGVGSAVHMLGWRQDLAQIMMACDLFILPRPETPMEGLGLAVVEAQLAGMRLLLSRGIAEDALLSTARYSRLGLDEGPEAWAAAAVNLLDSSPPSVTDTFAALRASPMDMDFALADLLALHQ